MTVSTGYQPGPGTGVGTSGGGMPAEEPEYEGRSLDALKKAYAAYLSGKQAEIKEQQDARRYVHGSQWTAKQIKTFNDRRQPVVTYNRIGRKINAVIGLLERQRQDPRGYPRTPKHEEGAEIATSVLRYVLDEEDWKAKSPIAALDGAVDGIGGVEIVLEQGDVGDVEVGLEVVDSGSFFYDSRSLKMDFTDARDMGVGKWADPEVVKEMFPDKSEDIDASLESGSELTSNPDSDGKWLSTEGGMKRIRIVDHWYIHKGEWCWCVYTGTTKLAEGKSYLKTEKGKTFCKYVMFSANVDQDGDRYGFVRNMKSSQDEINQRRSKALHIGNSRRIIIQDGEGLDVEKIRTEAARPDGVIIYPHGAQPPEFEDASKGAELNAQLGFLADAKQEIENYGFNPALMGTGVQDMSGRAIQLQQQAGIAELGPYLIAYKGWKLRVYRAIWNAVQQHWTKERWIRVTDDEQMAQFFAVNQLGIDPRTGLPTIINQLGALDVDIILDEGPDTLNAAQDTNDTLTQILPAIAPMLSPQVAQAALKLLVDTSALPASAKKQFREAADQAQQPNPQQQMAQQLQMRGEVADVQETEASARLKQAQAEKAMAEAQNVGREAEQNQASQIIDINARAQDAQSRAELGRMNVRLKSMDIIGKRLDLAARAQPQPQPNV